MGTCRVLLANCVQVSGTLSLITCQSPCSRFSRHPCERNGALLASFISCGNFRKLRQLAGPQGSAYHCPIFLRLLCSCIFPSPGACSLEVTQTDNSVCSFAFDNLRAISSCR